MIKGNRFSVRQDLIGLTRTEKKRIWNQEYWDKQHMHGGGSEAAKEARREWSRYRRSICPPSIIGVCPDPIWWKTNDASFKRGLHIALLKFKSNVG